MTTEQEPIINGNTPEETPIHAEQPARLSLQEIAQRAKERIAQIRQNATATTFKKTDYIDLLNTRENSEKEIQKISEDYVNKMEDLYNGGVDVGYTIDDLADNWKVLIKSEDAGFPGAQEIIDVVWDLDQNKIDLDDPKIDPKDIESFRKVNEEVETEIQNVLNSPEVKKVVEYLRTKMLEKMAQETTDHTNWRLEEVRRIAQSANDRLKKHNQLIKEVREKTEDPLITAKIREFERQDSENEITNAIREALNTKEDAEEAVEAVLSAQERTITTILKAVNEDPLYEGQKDDELRTIIHHNLIYPTTQEGRKMVHFVNIAMLRKLYRDGVAQNKANFIPWRGGKIGEGENYMTYLSRVKNAVVDMEALDYIEKNEDLTAEQKSEIEKIKKFKENKNTVLRQAEALLTFVGIERYEREDRPGRNIYDILDEVNKLTPEERVSRAKTFKDEEKAKFLKAQKEITEQAEREEKKRLAKEKFEADKETDFQARVADLKQKGLVIGDTGVVFTRFTPGRGKHRGESSRVLIELYDIEAGNKRIVRTTNIGGYRSGEVYSVQEMASMLGVKADEIESKIIAKE